MFAFIVEPSDDAKVELIRQLLDRIGYVVRSVRTVPALDQAREAAGRGNHLIIVPDTAATILPFDRVIELAQRLSDGEFLLYVTNSIEPDLYKALVRTGSADWVGWDSALTEIREISRRKRSLQTSSKDAPGAVPHTVSVFLGAGGGVGTTTLALESALWLAGQKRKGQSVALVDLEPQDSVMCDYVDLTPRVKLAELARDPARLDDYLLNIFTTQHSTGLHIFASEHEKVDLASMDPVGIFTLLNRLVERYQSVIVDAGSSWMPWTEGVVTHADKIFVVARYTVPSVKTLARRLTDLKEIGIPVAQTAVVLNQCETTLFGRHLRNGQIDGLFSGFETHYVGFDRETANESVNTGSSVMLTAPRSHLGRDIKKVAEAVAQVVPRA
jgi:pilus assembly protein CpaE